MGFGLFSDQICEPSQFRNSPRQSVPLECGQEVINALGRVLEAFPPALQDKLFGRKSEKSASRDRSNELFDPGEAAVAGSGSGHGFWKKERNRVGRSPWGALD